MHESICGISDKAVHPIETSALRAYIGGILRMHTCYS